MRLLKNVMRLDEALIKVKQEIGCSTRVATMSLNDAVGRVAAANTYAPTPVPHFRRSTMDGYAVCAAATAGASDAMPSLLLLDRHHTTGCIGVLTGGAVPEGFDSVVMSEYAEELADGTVLVTRPVAVGENVIDIGEDVREQELILQQGMHVTPYHIAVLAAVGITHVDINCFKVGVISTGNEVLPISSEPLPGQIRDVNSHLVVALLRKEGFDADYLGIVEDDREKLSRILEHNLTLYDAIVLSGGSSAGTLDYTEQVINGLTNGKVLVHGLAVKPGKPTILAAVNNKLVIGLPGHPLSCAIIAGAVALPLLAHAAGFMERVPETMVGVLTRSVASAPGRRDYLPVVIHEGATVTPLLSKSAAIKVLAECHGLLVIPENCEGLNSGCSVEVLVWR